MAFSGKYELVKDEGHLEHMLAIGIPEEFAKRASDLKTVEIAIDGDKVTISRGDGRKSPTYTLDQETAETFPNGRVAKNKATLKGNVLTVETDGDGGNWKREYTLVGSELTVVSSHSKPGVPVGKRIYKKL